MGTALTATGVDVAWGILATVHGSRAFTPDETENLRARLQELVAAEGRGGQGRIAKRLGLTQQAISQAIRGGSLGAQLAKAIAKHDGVTLDSLLQGAKASEPLRLPLSKRAPTLAQAVARHPGRWSPEEVAEAEGMKFRFNRPEDGWEAVLDTIQGRGRDAGRPGAHRR